MAFRCCYRQASSDILSFISLAVNDSAIRWTIITTTPGGKQAQPTSALLTYFVSGPIIPSTLPGHLQFWPANWASLKAPDRSCQYHKRAACHVFESVSSAGHQLIGPEPPGCCNSKLPCQPEQDTVSIQQYFVAALMSVQVWFAGLHYFSCEAR